MLTPAEVDAIERDVNAVDTCSSLVRKIPALIATIREIRAAQSIEVVEAATDHAFAERAMADTPEQPAQPTNEQRKDTMSEPMVRISTDDLLMIAWNAYESTDGFENTKRWAAQPQHVNGSLLAAFRAGWKARGDNQAQPSDGVALIAKERAERRR